MALTRRFRYELLPKYPHMKPADIAIWERFIVAFPDFYDTVDYDTPLGAGRPIPNGTQENIAADFRLLTQRKADVVANAGDRVDVVEIKPQAGPSALGQALANRELYVAEHPEAKDARAVVITDEILPDMETLAAKLGVVLLSIPKH